MAKQQTIDGADEVEDSRMGLGEHLTELRMRLIRCVGVMFIAFCVLYAYRPTVLDVVRGPQLRASTMLRAEYSERTQLEFEERIQSGALTTRGSEFSEEVGLLFDQGWPDAWVLLPSAGPPQEMLVIGSDGGFFMLMRICFWLALLITGPLLIWEAWGFVASGLYKAEKRTAYAYFPVSLVLFFGGVLFGYFVMIPYALYFLNLDSLNLKGIDVQVEISSYLGFLKGLSLALGFVFQLPIVMVAMTSLGLVDPASYAKFRKHTLVAALVVGAMLTPPDPITQLLMAGPVILLYEIGLRVARLVWTEPLVSLDDDEEEASSPANG